MIIDIEKQFYDTFGIEPKYKTCVFDYCKNKKEYDCENCNDKEWHYPQITDSILLELIRLGLNYDFVIHSKSVEELKEKLLALLIYNEAEFKQQVQALFEDK